MGPLILFYLPPGPICPDKVSNFSRKRLFSAIFLEESLESFFSIDYYRYASGSEAQRDIHRSPELNKRPNKEFRMKSGYLNMSDSGARKSSPTNSPHESAYAFATSDENDSPIGYRRPVKNDDDFSKLQTQLAKGSAKLCHVCGGIMKKRTRRVLSWSHGLALMITGTFLMSFYGWATHFYQAPWLIKFSLPAIYYIGSIFIAVGILFFFIRENVWKCLDCREISKR